MRSTFIPMTMLLLLAVPIPALGRSEFGGEDKACADTGNAEAAISACTRLSENRGLGKRNRAIALGNRGAAYKTLGRYEEAVADFDQASELDPGNPQYYCQRGDVHIRTGALDAAIADYSAALTRSPHLAWALQGRGRAYLAKNDGELAFVNFSDALQRKPGDFVLLAQRGRAANLAKRYDIAVTDLSEAMTHDKFTASLPKERAELFAQRGFAYIKQGKAEEARRDADEALRLSPKSAFAIGIIGLVEEKQANTEKARDAFNRALAIEPDLKLAKLGLERLGGAGGAASAQDDGEPVAQSDPVDRRPPPSTDAPPESGPEMCARYIPAVGRTVKVKCTE